MRRRRSHSRIGSLRKWWHGVLGHHILTTTVRDYRQFGPARYEFYYRPGWLCVDCHVSWPR